ncbi:AraC family transcriptional regulator [Sphingomonas sp. 28-63-12]|uniref:AraC family transcriptional regulator n=1 Tax=Sphingomonas sp. 28-63-12 TaxID=1970434 RepID=UPI000BDBFC26|nr:MAG: AraC family transcriptional regulator [Sphingomonas sp. 28-63-12]
MAFDQLDAAVRVAAMTTILLLAWLLVHRSRSITFAALLFLPLAICLSGFVIGNSAGALLRPVGLLGSVAHLVSGYTVIFLWWFSLSCFDSRFRVIGGVLAGGLAWATIASADRGLFGPTIADRGLSRLLMAMGFAIVGHLVWRLIAERAGDLIQQRHDSRVMVAVLLGGMLFVDLAADAAFGVAWRPPAFAITQNVMILGFAVWLADKLLTVRPELPSFRDLAEHAAGSAAPLAANQQDDDLHRRLSELIGTQRLFLDPDLTFATFVARMGAPERAVRLLINHGLGFDHFRSFLNHHRLAESRRLLRDPRRADDKLIAIALDSGFASLASFNRVFRAIEGCSPTQYRAAALQADPKGDRPAQLPPLPGFEERKAGF